MQNKKTEMLEKLLAAIVNQRCYRRMVTVIKKELENEYRKESGNIQNANS